MLKIFRKLEAMLLPEPEMYAQPDLTGKGLGIDWWISALGENKEIPERGDVIIHIESCSMGTSVRRDTRWRVIGEGSFPRSVRCHREEGGGESFTTLHCFYMRRHAKLAHTWLLMD